VPGFLPFLSDFVTIFPVLRAGFTNFNIMFFIAQARAEKHYFQDHQNDNSNLIINVDRVFDTMQ